MSAQTRGSAFHRTFGTRGPDGIEGFSSFISGHTFLLALWSDLARLQRNKPSRILHPRRTVLPSTTLCPFTAQSLRARPSVQDDFSPPATLSSLP